MKEAVENSGFVIAIITDGGDDPSHAYFARPFCLAELRWAVNAGRYVQPVIDMKDKEKIGQLLQSAPDDLRGLGMVDFVDLNRTDQRYFVRHSLSSHRAYRKELIFLFLCCAGCWC